MEKHLSGHSFFVADHYTIADIWLFAYTHVADEGGFDLTRFPAIQAWIERIKAMPQHIGITQAGKYLGNVYHKTLNLFTI